MFSDFNIRVQPQVHFLTEEQVKEIHNRALLVLERTGVEVHDEEVLDLLSSAGCRVSNKRVVKIPSYLVEESISWVPKGFNLSYRTGEKNLFVQGNKSYWGTGSDLPFIRDSFSFKRRKTSLFDVEQVSKLVQSMENLDFLMCMGCAHEISPQVADKYHFVAMVENSVKPIVFTAASEENLKDIYEMATIVAGSKERLTETMFIAHYTEPIAPLIHPKDSLRKLLFCVEKKIPVIYSAATTAGQNGPATLAGSLILSVSRMLSGFVIGQLANRGAPMVITFHASSMEPSNCIHLYSSPEHVIAQAAAKDIAKYYGVPTWGRAGCTDSKVMDEQGSFEAGYEILMQALSGENLIHDVGYLESGLTASFDSIVMCNEFIGAVKRIIHGFELSEETMALDVIHEVGPSGHYLTQPHTMDHFRQEYWFPKLLDRSNYQTWNEGGEKTLFQRSNEVVKEILQKEMPPLLEKERKKEILQLAAIEHTGK